MRATAVHPHLIDFFLFVFHGKNFSTAPPKNRPLHRIRSRPDDSACDPARYSGVIRRRRPWDPRIHIPATGFGPARWHRHTLHRVQVSHTTYSFQAAGFGAYPRPRKWRLSLHGPWGPSTSRFDCAPGRQSGHHERSPLPPELHLHGRLFRLAGWPDPSIVHAQSL